MIANGTWAEDTAEQGAIRRREEALEAIRFIRDLPEKSGADAQLRARFEAWRAMLRRLPEYRHWLSGTAREKAERRTK